MPDKSINIKTGQTQNEPDSQSGNKNSSAGELLKDKGLVPILGEVGAGKLTDKDIMRSRINKLMNHIDDMSELRSIRDFVEFKIIQKKKVDDL